MIKMGLNDILKKAFGKTEKAKLMESIEAVKDTYNEAETKKEAIQNAVDRIVREIKTSPNMPVIEFLKMIQKEENLSNDIIVEVTKQILDIKPEKTAIEIVEKIDLPSKDILKIIKLPDVSLEAAKKMAEEIPDEVLQKQERQRLDKIERERREAAKAKKETEIKKQLREKYKTCERIKGSDLVEELKLLERKTESKEIHTIIKQVLARKAAIEWRRSGSARVASIAQVIPPEEMLEKDFPQLVGMEFEEVKTKKEYQGPKEYEYREEDLQNLILSEIAKNVADIYNRVGIIDMPQLEKMKELTEQQEEGFISEIQQYVDAKKRKALDIEKIKKEFRGIEIDELGELRELVEKVPEKDRGEIIRTLKSTIQSKKEEPLDPEVENQLAHLRDELKHLKEEDAIEILEDTRAEVKDRRKQRREEARQKDAIIQTNNEEEHTH